MAETTITKGMPRAVRLVASHSSPAVRPRWRNASQTRCLSTTAPVHKPALEKQPPSIEVPPYSVVNGSKSNRREALQNAKPFSEFLTDNFNRQHDYLRISITERCNLRCVYCMPAEGVPLSPPAHLLTTPEIFYLSSLFVSQGVTKIRLTGGEPTVRKDIIPLMQQIGSLRSKGLREIALTTNGLLLHRKLDAMVEAGLTGVNMSLDTLDPFQFQIMTRRKGFDVVMRGIDRILEMNKMGANIKLKINCVVMRGVNEREILPFVEMGIEKDIEVRFIEYMPFGGNKWSKGKMLSYQEMLDIIRTKYPDVHRVQGHKNDTSKTFKVPGFVGRIGFITSMTEDFCGSCNRLRITGDGNLKVCLHGNAEVSLRDMLREGNDGKPIDEEAFEAIKQLEMDRHQGRLPEGTPLGWGERESSLLNLIGTAVKRKKEKHAGMGELENMENRPMILIDNPRHQTKEQLLGDQRQRQRLPSSIISSPWRTIPGYLLHPYNFSSTGFASARAFSTSTTSRKLARQEAASDKMESERVTANDWIMRRSPEKWEYANIPRPRFHASNVGTTRPAVRPGDFSELKVPDLPSKDSGYWRGQERPNMDMDLPMRTVQRDTVNKPLQRPFECEKWGPGHQRDREQPTIVSPTRQFQRDSANEPLQRPSEQAEQEREPDHWFTLTDPKAFTIPSSPPQTLSQWQWQIHHLENRVNTIFATVARLVLPASRKEVWRICKGLSPKELQELEGTETKMIVRKIQVESAVAKMVQRRHEIMERTGKDPAMNLSWSKLREAKTSVIEEKLVSKSPPSSTLFLNRNPGMEREYDDPFHISKMLMKRAAKERAEKAKKGVRVKANRLRVEILPSLIRWRREVWAIAKTISERGIAHRKGKIEHGDGLSRYEEFFQRARTSQIEMRDVENAVQAARRAKKFYLNNSERGRTERAALKELEERQSHEVRGAHKIAAMEKAVHTLGFKIRDWRAELGRIKEILTGETLRYSGTVHIRFGFKPEEKKFGINDAHNIGPKRLLRSSDFKAAKSRPIRPPEPQDEQIPCRGERRLWLSPPDDPKIARAELRKMEIEVDKVLNHIPGWRMQLGLPRKRLAGVPHRSGMVHMQFRPNYGDTSLLSPSSEQPDTLSSVRTRMRRATLKTVEAEVEKYHTKLALWTREIFLIDESRKAKERDTKSAEYAWSTHPLQNSLAASGLPTFTKEPGQIKETPERQLDLVRRWKWTLKEELKKRFGQGDDAYSAVDQLGPDDLADESQRNRAFARFIRQFGREANARSITIVEQWKSEISSRLLQSYGTYAQPEIDGLTSDLIANAYERGESLITLAANFQEMVVVRLRAEKDGKVTDAGLDISTRLKEAEIARWRRNIRDGLMGRFGQGRDYSMVDQLEHDAISSKPKRAYARQYFEKMIKEGRMGQKIINTKSGKEAELLMAQWKSITKDQLERTFGPGNYHKMDEMPFERWKDAQQRTAFLKTLYHDISGARENKSSIVASLDTTERSRQEGESEEAYMERLITTDEAQNFIAIIEALDQEMVLAKKQSDMAQEIKIETGKGSEEYENLMEQIKIEIMKAESRQTDKQITKLQLRKKGKQMLDQLHALRLGSQVKELKAVEPAHRQSNGDARRRRGSRPVSSKEMVVRMTRPRNVPGEKSLNLRAQPESEGGDGVPQRFYVRTTQRPKEVDEMQFPNSPEGHLESRAESTSNEVNGMSAPISPDKPAQIVKSFTESKRSMAPVRRNFDLDQRNVSPSPASFLEVVGAMDRVRERLLGKKNAAEAKDLIEKVQARLAEIAIVNKHYEVIKAAKEGGMAFKATDKKMAPLRQTMDLDETQPKQPKVEAQQQSHGHLTHLTPSGTAHMVNITPKQSTHRLAIAIGTVSFSNPATLGLVRSAALKKGDVLGVARIAGIQAAKLCPMIIPLCHPIAISGVEVDVTVVDAVSAPGEQTQQIHTRQEDKGSFHPPLNSQNSSQSLAGSGTALEHGGIHIAARVECVGPTGVEMEALTAVMGACLTVVDMVKAVDRGACIGDVRVVRKMGGRSGEWVDEGYVGGK